MAGVTFDNSASSTGAAVTGISATLTVGTGMNRAIVVGIILQSTGAQPTSVSVSGAGASGWTQPVNSITNWLALGATGNGFTQMWVATAPSTGSQTVTATWTNSANALLFVSTFSNVNQTTPYGGESRTQPRGTGSSDVLGTTAAVNGYPMMWCSSGEIVVDVVAADAGTLVVSGGDASQTFASSGTAGSVLGAMSYAGNNGPLIGMGWSTGSTGTNWLHSAVTLIPLTYTPSAGTLLSACGTILPPAATLTGKQIMVGLGFSPRVIFFTFAGRGANVGHHVQIGVACRDASNTVHQFVWASAEGDNNTSPTTDMEAVETDGCLGDADAINARWSQFASMSSIDSDGFTLNWTKNLNTFPAPVWFWAIGGSDIANANLVQWSDPTTTGSKSVTGAGFKPTFAMFFDWGITAALPYVGLTGSGYGFGFGMASDSSHRFAIGGYGQGGVAGSTNSAKELMTDHCHVLLTTGVNNGPTVSADFTSFDADGFTLNYDTVGASAFKSIALLLQGAFQKFLSTITQSATTGNQTITTNFTPTILGLYGTSQTATGFSTGDCQVLAGYGASTSQRWGYWTAEVNASSQQVMHSEYETLSLITINSQVATGSTLIAKADLTAVSLTGATINWSTNDGVARILPVFAFGPGGGWSGPVGVIPGSPGRARVWSIFPNGR